MSDDEPAKPVKKPRRGKVTRDKIIEVAESLIAQQGPDGFQLQNVTEQLGITPPAIYNHFKDREDLVAHIAEKGGKMLAAVMRRNSGDDILTSLRRNARRYVDFLVNNPAHARIILWDLARRGTSGWRGLAASNMEMREHMRSSFEAAAERGEIRSISIETYLQYLYIGTAASAIWTDYDYPSPGNDDRPPAPLRKPTPDEVDFLKHQAEDLVVRLLSPDLGEVERL